MSGLVQRVLAGDQGAHICGLEGGEGSDVSRAELCRVGGGGYSGTVLVVGQCYLEEGASAAAGWT